MLNSIIAFALRHRLPVLACALLVSGYGIYTALRMPIDVLPDVNRPTVTILTEAGSLTPQNIERFVTIPLEQTLNGLPGVTQVRSDSGLGLSKIDVQFEWGTDLYRNRQIVQEKLQSVRAKLPAGVEMNMAPVTSLIGQIQFVGIQSKSGGTNVNDLRALTDLNIRPRLLSIPGVAAITIAGGAPKQLQVTLDPVKMAAFDVTTDDVAQAIKAANANASGGVLNLGAKGPMIAVSGGVESARQIASSAIRSDGPRPVRIEDVARVEFGTASIRVGDAGINAKPGVILYILKQPGVDTVKLTERINRELADIQSTAPEDVLLINDIFQQAEFIHRAVNNVLEAVRDGAILVVIVLFLFLFNLRSTLITLTAIPLSVAVTAIVFSAFGLTINTMTLGGLAVAIGALVDDAIVDVENVFRRLRHNAMQPQPDHPLLVIFRASSEVRNPILIGTLLVVAVYLPLFFLSGLEGKLFTPVGIAYIISTLASLVVSLTVTPVLCYYFATKKKIDAHSDTMLVRFLKKIAGRVIGFSMAFPMQIFGLLIALVLVAGLFLYKRSSEFLPAFNEGVAQVNISLPPDTSLEFSNGYGMRLEKMLTQVEGVRHVGRRTGRAEGDQHADGGVEATETIVTFDPKAKRSREAILAEIRAKLAEEFPGVASEVEQPLSHLLSHMLSGVDAQVAIKIYGPDLELLNRTSAEIREVLKPIKGVVDLAMEQQTVIDQVEIVPDRERLARAGLKVGDVTDIIDLVSGGEELSRMIVGQTSFPIVLRIDEKRRRDLNDLSRLQIRSPDGKRAALGDVADIRISKTPNSITREDASRLMVVKHNIANRALSEVVADVEKALEPIRAKLAKQNGYSIRVSGQFEAQAEATRLISILSFVSLAAMFLILYVHFGSFNLSAQVLLSIPMAFVGAVAWIVASKQDMSVATLVGLISLGGIAARNSILLIDHYIHLMREEKEPFSRAMIVRAGQERMAPVLMTALCSGIALVPLALSAGEPGREILYPVATVILGGLISSTLLDFLVTPGVFWTFGRRDAERLAYAPHRPDKAAGEMAEEFAEMQVPQHTTGPHGLALEGVSHV